MGMVFEKLKSQIEDLLFQWEQKEASHVATIRVLEDEVAGLRVRLAETESIVRRLTEEKEKLECEMAVLLREEKEKEPPKKSWRQLFML